jgi:hypothetical protein
VLSDDWLPDRLGDTAALAQLVPGVLVHAGAVVEGTDAPMRDDRGVLAGLARATEGVGFRTGDAPVASLAWLVRARSLDNLHIKAPGWRQRANATCRGELVEGTECEWWGEGNALADAIVVEGDVWGHHVERVLRPDPGRALAVARELAFLDDGDLGERAERAAHALNGKWSLYADWGGPGTHDHFELTISCCRGHGGRGMFGVVDGFSVHLPDKPRAPLAPILRLQLAPAIASCKPTAHVVAELENTLDEVTDVKVTVEPADAALATCIEDAIWAVPLHVPGAYPHEHTRVTF